MLEHIIINIACNILLFQRHSKKSNDNKRKKILDDKKDEMNANEEVNIAKCRGKKLPEASGEKRT